MKKRVSLDEAYILDDVLDEITDKSKDFKALVLRLFDKIGNVKEVSEMTKIPTSTIYKWIEDWNKKKDLH